mmetsp:Transcript_20365/g.50649  ORF Transcript_20365/g.50649 Transcript_20365/m.50649 type:complete len:201 (-) Transcript_20365:376-978(-)
MAAAPDSLQHDHPGAGPAGHSAVGDAQRVLRRLLACTEGTHGRGGYPGSHGLWRGRRGGHHLRRHYRPAHLQPAGWAPRHRHGDGNHHRPGRAAGLFLPQRRRLWPTSRVPLRQLSGRGRARRGDAAQCARRAFERQPPGDARDNVRAIHTDGRRGQGGWTCAGRRAHPHLWTQVCVQRCHQRMAPVRLYPTIPGPVHRR